MAAPRLSVVLALGDDRGPALESVRAWTGQALPAGLYEVVAVDDRRRARRAERVRQALRSHDQLVVVSTAAPRQRGRPHARGRRASPAFRP